MDKSFTTLWHVMLLIALISISIDSFMKTKKSRNILNPMIGTASAVGAILWFLYLIT